MASKPFPTSHPTANRHLLGASQAGSRSARRQPARRGRRRRGGGTEKHPRCYIKQGDSRQMSTTHGNRQRKLLHGFIASATLASTSHLLLNSGDAIAGQKQGIIKVEQVRQGVFNVTYRRLWEENYYMTDVYMVDCNRKLATFKGERHLRLVSEEHLIEKVCEI